MYMWHMHIAHVQLNIEDYAPWGKCSDMKTRGKTEAHGQLVPLTHCKTANTCLPASPSSSAIFVIYRKCSFYLIEFSATPLLTFGIIRLGEWLPTNNVFFLSLKSNCRKWRLLKWSPFPLPILPILRNILRSIKNWEWPICEMRGVFVPGPWQIPGDWLERPRPLCRCLQSEDMIRMRYSSSGDNCSSTQEQLETTPATPLAQSSHNTGLFVPKWPFETPPSFSKKNRSKGGNRNIWF